MVQADVEYFLLPSFQFPADKFHAGENLGAASFFSVLPLAAKPNIQTLFDYDYCDSCILK